MKKVFAIYVDRIRATLKYILWLMEEGGIGGAVVSTIGMATFLENYNYQSFEKVAILFIHSGAP